MVLNEEQWIKELREKRIAYGISQGRLAVASGITREYFNKIESGKMKPSKELLETLHKELARFNPEVPLTMLFDYVKIRFPTLDIQHIIKDILKLNINYMLHEDYGRYSYTEHYSLGDIFIYTSADEEKGVLLELKGRGCRQFESYLLAQQRSWYDFLMDALVDGGVMKRIDLAINDHTGILDIPELAEKCRKREYIGKSRSYKFYQSGELIKHREDDREYMGRTLYLGSLKSDVYFCVYEKDYEQYVKLGTPLEEADIINHFEIRLRNERAYYAVRDLLTYYDAEQTAFDDKQVFDEYIRVIEEEYTIDNTIEYDIYKEPNHQVQNFFQSEYYDFDPVLKLSDYNRLLELRKMPLLSLNDNEYYIVTNSKFAYEVEDNKDIETITVANKNLKLKGYDTKSYWNSITNTGRFVVVLPDKYVQGLEVSENHLIIDTKEDTDAELENKIKEAMQHQLVKVDENGEINDESYRVNVRGAEIEQQKAMVAIVVSLFMYIAFILISAVGTILAVQSLSDSTKYKYRYLTLRRLGINDKSLFKTIRKQLLILFCVPAISAILCSFVMMSSLNNVYQQILGDKHLYLMYFGLNLIIFFLIYSIYWIATYIGFKRNINEAS